MAVFFATAYSISATVIVNCQFYQSVPSENNEKALDQRIALSKTPAYYFTLGAWSPKKQVTRSVTRSLTNQISKGGIVTVYVNKDIYLYPGILLINN